MRGKSAGKRNQVNIFEFDWLSGLNKHYVNKFQYGGFSSAKKGRPVDDLESKNSAVSTSEISEVQHLYT